MSSFFFQDGVAAIELGHRLRRRLIGARGLWNRTDRLLAGGYGMRSSFGQIRFRRGIEWHYHRTRLLRARWGVLLLLIDFLDNRRLDQSKLIMVTNRTVRFSPGQLPKSKDGTRDPQPIYAFPDRLEGFASEHPYKPQISCFWILLGSHIAPPWFVMPPQVLLFQWTVALQIACRRG
jgi:hypothetical protein